MSTSEQRVYFIAVSISMHVLPHAHVGERTVRPTRSVAKFCHRFPGLGKNPDEKVLKTEPPRRHAIKYYEYYD